MATDVRRRGEQAAAEYLRGLPRLRDQLIAVDQQRLRRAAERDRGFCFNKHRSLLILSLNAGLAAIELIARTEPIDDDYLRAGREERVVVSKHQVLADRKAITEIQVPEPT